MTDPSLPMTAYSIQSAKPSVMYGQSATLPVANASAIVLLRVALDKVPAAATVTSATVSFTTAQSSSGSSTVSIQPATSAWTSAVTWGTKPTTTTALDSRTISSPTPGTLWTWDVTAWAQSVVSGSVTNYGLQVYTTGANPVTFNGTRASSGFPVLTLTYLLLPDTPSNLHPSSGVVSLAKPTVTFDGDDDITGLQVQIDSPPGDSSPTFDSGTVTATAGLLDLSTTSFSGLTSGTPMVWRVRQQNATGWSPWSSWASLSRLSKSSLSITSPTSSTITDGTPTIQWSFGGTQVAWRATIEDATTGKILSDSGRRIGTGASWTPAKGLTKDGQAGVIRVYVWDSVDRTATPGDPSYTSVSETVTLDLDAGVGPMDTVDVIQEPPSPSIRIQGTRAAGVPDQVALFRDGTQIGRWNGTSVFTGTHFAVYDHEAPMHVPVSYRVAPITITGGVAHIAKGGTAETFVPTCAGIWLIDESDPSQQVGVMGADDQEQTAPETSVLHTPISSDGDIEVIRRRLVRMPPQGTVTGLLVDAMEQTAAASESALRGFVDNDAGHTYRLVIGRQNLRVIVGDINFVEQSIDTVVERVLGVSFNWWAKADQS